MSVSRRSVLEGRGQISGRDSMASQMECIFFLQGERKLRERQDGFWRDI